MEGTGLEMRRLGRRLLRLLDLGQEKGVWKKEGTEEGSTIRRQDLQNLMEREEEVKACYLEF